MIMRYKIPMNNRFINIENNTSYNYERNLESYLDAQLINLSKLNYMCNEQILWNISVETCLNYKNISLNYERDIYLSPENRNGIVGKYLDIKKNFFQINNFERGFLQLWDCNIKKIKILILKYNQYYLVQEIYAVIRWLLYYCALELEGGIIHSSAVEYAGKGIIIIGDKGTGKTTLLTALLNKGAKYIASDRSFFWKQEGAIHISGWICTYRVDMNSLKLSLEENKLKRINQYIENNHDNSEFMYNRKFRFPTCDFLYILNFDICYSAKLSKIIYLDSSVNHERELTITKETLKEKLSDQLLFINLPKKLCSYKPAHNSKELEQIDTYRVVGRKNPSAMVEKILDHIWRN